MKEDAIMNADDDGGWVVAGVLTDLTGAVLTVQAGEAGLAGTVEMEDGQRAAANDARWEGGTGAAR